jgi:hypothetical protein
MKADHGMYALVKKDFAILSGSFGHALSLCSMPVAMAPRHITRRHWSMSKTRDGFGLYSIGKGAAR